MRSTSLPVAAVLAAGICLTALVAGCSSNDSTSPPVNVPGPSFNFTFPQTGTSHEFTFIDVGTWGYVCTSHSGMAGTVVVAVGGPDSAGVVQVGPSNSQSFSPPSVTVKPGGKVRWVNVSTTMFNHTVTR